MTELKKHEEEGDEFVIKPQATAPAVDTSQWPLLLKNFDRRPFSSGALYRQKMTLLTHITAVLVRTGHFTP